MADTTTLITKQFPAALDCLYEMLNFVRTVSEKIPFHEKDISMIELALEEVLVNIISYGYPEKEGTIFIIHESLGKQGAKFIIKDFGIPYNPLTNAKKFDPTAPLEKRSLGGYGIFFILKIMDEVSYQRQDNANVLTLMKYTSAE